MAEACLIQVVFERGLCLRIAMNDKGVAYLLHILARREVLYHLVVITVSAKALDLSHLCADTMVVAKDTNEAQGRVLYACAQRRWGTVSHNQNRGRWVVYMVRHMVLDASCLV